jgi:hypothetical protein
MWKNRYVLLIFLLLIGCGKIVLAQWVNSNGGFVSVFECFAVNSNETGGTNLFAGTWGNGVFLSTDDGTSWNDVNNGLIYPTQRRVYTLVSSGKNLFAGTDWGIYISTNNGTNWAIVDSEFTGTTIRSLAVLGTNLFASISGKGVFLSTNNGISWTLVKADPSILSFAVSGTNIYAGSWGSGVLMSTNNGATWDAINSGLTDLKINTVFVKENYLYAGNWNGNGVFRSTNNGVSWVPASTGISVTGSSGNPTEVYALAVCGMNLLAGTSAGIYLSSNNGDSWSKVNGSTIGAFIVAGTKLYAAQGAGYYFSTDSGVTWNDDNIVSANNPINCLAISGSYLFAGGEESRVPTFNGGVFVSANNGKIWKGGNNGLTVKSVRTLAADGTNLFAGTYGGGIFLSTDNGSNWVAVNSGLTKLHITALVISGTNLFAAVDRTDGGGVFLSTNNGTSWTEVNDGLTSLFVTSMVVNESNIFASTSSGVFRFDKNQNYWTAVNSGLTNTKIGHLASNGSNLYASVSSGVGFYMSENNGSNWTVSNSGLDNVNCLTSVGSNLFAGTYSDALFSSDNGITWSYIDSGFTKYQQISAMAVNGTDVFAGTYFGVFRRSLSEVTSVKDISGTDYLPSSFSLQQNYPNPFNPNTTIRFELPENAHVILNIYNSMGQEVTKLISQDMGAGIHSVNWNASGFASGVYYYRMVTNNFAETKKLLLLK